MQQLHWFPKVLSLVATLFLVTQALAEQPDVVSPFGDDGPGGSSRASGRLFHRPSTADLPDIMAALQAGADHIISMQCPVSGGWDWPHGGCTEPPDNITAPIALGVLDAWWNTGDPDHLASAMFGGDHDLTSSYPTPACDADQPRFGAHTPHFLWRVSQKSGSSVYADFAQTGFWDSLDAGTYGCDSDWDTADWIAAVQAGRVGLWINLRPWEFEYLTSSKQANPGQEQAFIDGTLDGLNTLDPAAYYDTLGLSGAVRGLARACVTSFPPIDNPTHPDVDGLSTLRELVELLVSYQKADGAWNWASDICTGCSWDFDKGEGDKSTQVTAYAVLALVDASECLDKNDWWDNIRRGREWLLSMQLPGGGFASWGDSVDENTEIEGEALQALYSAKVALGACCNEATGDCLWGPEEKCVDPFSVFYLDQFCEEVDCAPAKGACCLPDGSCQDGLSWTTCTNPTGLAGAWSGADTTCEVDKCPDCDCDGDSDVKEIADCVAACINGGGDAGVCATACDNNGDGVPNDCSGGDANCDDDDPCTVDSCGGDGNCVNDPQDCSDGIDCTIDVCKPDPQSVCEDNGNPCDSDDDCKPPSNECSVTGNPCETDDDCNDSINETCDAVPGEACVVDTPYTCINKAVDSECDDDDACTTDRCLPAFDGETLKVTTASCGNTISFDIPDNPTSCEVSVPDDGGSIFDLDVQLRVNHSWVNDLIITLEHKDTGTSVVLWNQADGDSGDNVDLDIDILYDDEQPCTALCDATGCFGVCNSSAVGSGPLSIFDGESKSGDWTLTVEDTFTGDDGFLEGFDLIFNNFPGGCLSEPLPEINDGVDCTNDSCDPATGEITHESNDTKCDDGVACTVDTCDGTACVFTPDDSLCDDGDPCTIDSCDATDGCVAVVGPDKDSDGCCDAADPCPNDPKHGCGPFPDFIPDAGECVEVVFDAIILNEPSGLNSSATADGLPEDDTVHLQNGCFVVEIWTQETTAAKSGLACAFTDLAWEGDLSCQPKFTLIEYSDTFDQFRAGTIDNNAGTGTNIGGCTLLADVGVFPRWHRIATLHYEGTHPKCKNVLNLLPAEKGASLVGIGEVKEFQHRSALHDVECLGYIYNFVAENDEPAQPEVQPADFALFAPCWMAEGDLGECADRDFDCDGVVGPGDLNFFATAWQKGVCEPDIIVPACQLHCDTDAVNTDSEGTLANDGSRLQWASPQTIRSFGLSVPPRNWSGWELDPANQVQSPNKRVKARRDSIRGTR